MIRITILIIVSVALYFSLITLIEQQAPEVKDLSSVVPAKKEDPNPLPERILGRFVIDKKGSQKWIETQKHLNLSSVENFITLHQKQDQLAFNGKNIWFSNLEMVSPVKILAITDQHVRFSVYPNAPENNSHYTAFLQWDSSGGIWYSDYNHLQDGKKQLYRARYVRSKAQ